MKAERPTQPQEPDYDADARYARATREVEEEAKTCAFWAVFEAVDVPGLNTIKIEAELHLAYQRSSTAHPLRGVALAYVEAAIERRYEEICKNEG